MLHFGSCDLMFLRNFETRTSMVETFISFDEIIIHNRLVLHLDLVSLF